jgi:hypothetical protein
MERICCYFYLTLKDSNNSSNFSSVNLQWLLCRLIGHKNFKFKQKDIFLTLNNIIKVNRSMVYFIKITNPLNMQVFKNLTVFKLKFLLLDIYVF